MSKLIVAVLLSFLAAPSFAANYYVRTDGNDSCNGLYDTGGSSGNCAKLTVNGAHALTVAGDTVTIRDGTYSGTVTISRSGSAGNPITYTGTTSAVISNKISVSASYITINGIKISNRSCTSYASCAGDSEWVNNESVYFSGTASNNTIQNCLIDAGADVNGPYGNGIYSDGSNNANITITGNTFQNLNYLKGIVRPGYNSIYWTISNNTFVNTWNVDIFYIYGQYHTYSNNNISGNVITSADNHSDVFQTAGENGDEIAMYITIENNYAHDSECQLGFLTRDGNNNIHSFTFRNNIFANITSYLRVGIPTSKFYNNLFYNVGESYTLELGGEYPVYDNTNLEIFNNAFVGNQTPWSQNSNGTQSYTHNNNYFGNANFTAKNFTTGGVESDKVEGGNPQFTNAAGGDFTIGTTSVFKDAGRTIASFSIDKLGNLRPFGVSWDIGPYEYGASGGETGNIKPGILIPSGVTVR